MSQAQYTQKMPNAGIYNQLPDISKVCPHLFTLYITFEQADSEGSQSLFEAKAKSGLTYEQIAKAMGRYAILSTCLLCALLT